MRCYLSEEALEIYSSKYNFDAYCTLISDSQERPTTVSNLPHTQSGALRPTVLNPSL